MAGTYTVEGIRHILFGADHLLFVLGLLLLVMLQAHWANSRCGSAAAGSPRAAC